MLKFKANKINNTTPIENNYLVELVSGQPGIPWKSKQNLQQNAKILWFFLNHHALNHELKEAQKGKGISGVSSFAKATGLCFFI